MSVYYGISHTWLPMHPLQQECLAVYDFLLWFIAPHYTLHIGHTCISFAVDGCDTREMCFADPLPEKENVTAEHDIQPRPADQIALELIPMAHSTSPGHRCSSAIHCTFHSMQLIMLLPVRYNSNDLQCH